MRILIVTQAVDKNDPALGFFVEWIREFAKQCDFVKVLCLRKGEASLPNNVSIVALDDEGRHTALLRWWRYHKALKKGLKGTELVFFHMCPEYVVAGIPALIRFYGRKILWYTHASITWKLRLAEKFVDEIMTAADKSLRLRTLKKRVVGHGIPFDHFRTIYVPEPNTLRLLAVGRVARVKGIETLIKVIPLLRSRMGDVSIRLTIVGGVFSPEDMVYRAQLNRMINEQGLDGCVTFTGPIGYKSMYLLYAQHDILVHDSRTGGLDKVVLEAISSLLPVISSSEVNDFLPPLMRFHQGDVKSLTEAIIRFMNNPETFRRATVSIRDILIEKHSLSHFISRIISQT